MTIRFGIFLSLVVAGSLFARSAGAQSPPITFVPEIPIFGLLEKVITISSTSIGDYIRVIFVAFIWVVGILATVMVVYGGIKWVAAAGNAGRIKDARDIVDNAVIGVVIALTSVVLLNIINPSFTKLNGIFLGDVGKQMFGDTDVATGEFNEALTCTTKKGPIQVENTCSVSTVKFGWPVADVDPVVKSRVGPRDAAAGSKCHPGTDFSTDQKTNKLVVAMFSGKVVSITAACNESVVKVQSPEGFYARYIHVNKAYIKVGDTVTMGGIIGYSGGSPLVAGKDCSTGPHVHVELYSKDLILHDVYPCMNFQKVSAPPTVVVPQHYR